MFQARRSFQPAMRNHVQELISTNPNWLEYLERDLKIHVARDGHLVSLKYNQIESPMTLPIVQQCRGLVVDVERGEVVAWPYNKFWNHGEKLADEIDWTTARVQEKLDGSLMILYYDRMVGEWRVASSGTPTASGSFGSDSSNTFENAFWSLFTSLGYRTPDTVFRGWTFMFELCADENRIVVKHDKPRLVLHGARSSAGFEQDRNALEDLGFVYGWEVVREFPITSIAECLKAAEALDPLACEGFVVVDGAHRRVKIKSPRYVILHHMKGEATPRRAIELWQTGETGELLAHFPEMKVTIEPVQHMLETAVDLALVDVLANTRPLETLPTVTEWPDRKAYALAIKDKPWAAACFAMYGKADVTRADIAAALRGQTLASLERLLERMSPLRVHDGDRGTIVRPGAIAYSEGIE